MRYKLIIFGTLGVIALAVAYRLGVYEMERRVSKLEKNMDEHKKICLSSPNRGFRQGFVRPIGEYDLNKDRKIDEIELRIYEGEILRELKMREIERGVKIDEEETLIDARSRAGKYNLENK